MVCMPGGLRFLEAILEFCTPYLLYTKVWYESYLHETHTLTRTVDMQQVLLFHEICSLIKSVQCSEIVQKWSHRNWDL